MWSESGTVNKTQLKSYIIDIFLNKHQMPKNLRQGTIV